MNLATVLKASLLVVSLGFLSLAAGCASNGGEDMNDHRIVALEEDNANLRQQLTDVAAVEAAQGRELEAKERELGDLRQDRDRATQKASSLETDVQRFRREAEDARRSGSATPASTSDGPRRSSIDVSGLAGRNVEIVPKADGSVAVRLTGSVIFPPGGAELTEEGRRILSRVGAVLKSNPGVYVSVEGHTDGTPLGKTKNVWGTNLALSLARAMSVQDYLKRSLGIKEERMRVVGYGPHQPVVPGTGKAANEKNRRVELVLWREKS